ncbi:hypothetical protein R4064_00200 [Micrococcus yunnanensis]|uniref:Uncharacterized protein n=1 Tax=Micrococcus yunnanensis TaxID=566027 RepID=A0AAP5W8H1_9MICC|nr:MULTISPECIES: hypothetical protein [Micrococcus]MDV7176071.1 hypothetical protein [Micrococcus yunnanensis]WRQ43237.1 hypothetical protein SOY78_09580 [Micrococcus sp. HOU1]
MMSKTSAMVASSSNVKATRARSRCEMPLCETPSAAARSAWRLPERASQARTSAATIELKSEPLSSFEFVMGKTLWLRRTEHKVREKNLR